MRSLWFRIYFYFEQCLIAVRLKWKRIHSQRSEHTESQNFRCHSRTYNGIYSHRHQEPKKSTTQFFSKFFIYFVGRWCSCLLLMFFFCYCCLGEKRARAQTHSHQVNNNCSKYVVAKLLFWFDLCACRVRWILDVNRTVFGCFKK